MGYARIADEINATIAAGVPASLGRALRVRALRDLLEFHGLDFGRGPLTEGTAFGLGAGLGFLYLEVPGQAPPVYLVGRTADLERDFAAHLDIHLDIRSTPDPAVGWDWVREQIDAGHPPMVWADIARLEYLRVRMTNTRHDIVIVGYDEQEEIAWVADNDRDELQPCSLASLAAARNSNGFPGPNEHTIYIYDWPRSLPDPSAAVTAAVRGAVTHMLDAHAMPAEFAGGSGLTGIKEFAGSYPTWPEQFGTTLPQALNTLNVLIVKAGTGGAMFRSLHAVFLRDMGDLLGSAELARVAPIYDELAGAWIALADAAAAGDHPAGLEPVVTINRLELDGVTAMQQWLITNGER